MVEIPYFVKTSEPYVEICCPHCGEYLAAEWRHFEPEACRNIVSFCPSCRQKITHSTTKDGRAYLP